MTLQATRRVARRHKFRAEPVLTAEGERFDSKGEYSRWRELQLAEKGGAIKWLRRQVPVVLLDGDYRERIMLVWDFTYIQDGRKTYEDYKGVVTREFRLKLKLFRRLYPDVRVLLSGRGGLTEVQG